MLTRLPTRSSRLQKHAFVLGLVGAWSAASALLVTLI